LKEINVMKKMVGLFVLICVLLSLWGCNSQGSAFDSPKELAEAACACIYGFHDAELILALMPIQQGTELYDNTYENVTKIVKDAPFSDSFRVQSEHNLKKYDKELYDSCVDFLSNIGVDNVSQIHQCTCSIAFQDETEGIINIIVARVGNKWNLLEIYPA